jgi:hypothetical protein
MVEGLQRTNVNCSEPADSYGSSVCTDSPVSTYPSSSTVYPECQTSSPYPSVQQVWGHGVPVSTVTVTGCSLGRNTSLNTELSCTVPYIQLE